MYPAVSLFTLTKAMHWFDNVRMTTKRICFGAALFCVFLAVFVLLSPVVFAQGQNEVMESQSRYMQIVQFVYNFVLQNYVDDVDPRILYEGALRGMLEALDDPYTAYVDANSLMGTSLRDTTTGSFGGVGLSITKPLTSTPEKPAWVEVASPIEGTPGWRAGVQPGDLIIEIDGQPTADISMEEVLDRLRGRVGTTVTILLRRGRNMEFPVTLTRALIEVPTVRYAMMDNGIGYIRIIEFTPLTEARVQEALDSFKKDGYSGLIIDVRNNPGGLITSVVDVADKFIDTGVIVSTRSRINRENREFTARRSRTTFRDSVPVVVLINRGSASASEILAGALKDHRVAYLVGETTYGKGSVQQVQELISRDAIKLTIARYYSPSGATIDKAGVPPDIEVAFPELTDDDEKHLSALLQTTEIADFVSGRQELSSAQAEAFAQQLFRRYPVPVRILRRMIMQEFYRTHIAPLYDLEFDIQLQRAVELIGSPDLPARIREAKNVQELQKERASAAAATALTGSAATAPTDSAAAAP